MKAPQHLPVFADCSKVGFSSLAAADRARLADYHRTQLARFTGTRDTAPPRRRPTHVHVHLPAGWGTRTHDQPTTTGDLPLARRGQTTEPPSAGFEGSSSVDLRGKDQAGRNWGVRIYGPRGEENADQDPDRIIAAGDEDKDGLPGAKFEDRIARAIAPTNNADQRNPASLRSLQALMAAHYARRS
jgi:hypothetical protein